MVGCIVAFKNIEQLKFTIILAGFCQFSFFLGVFECYVQHQSFLGAADLAFRGSWTSALALLEAPLFGNGDGARSTQSWLVMKQEQSLKVPGS